MFLNRSSRNLIDSNDKEEYLKCSYHLTICFQVVLTDRLTVTLTKKGISYLFILDIINKTTANETKR